MWQNGGTAFKPDANILRHLKAKRQKQRVLAEVKLRCLWGHSKNFEDLDTFHRAIRPYLCLAQIFGIMPLSNVLSRDPQEVKFRMRSMGMVFTVVFLLLGGLKTIIVADRLLTVGLNAKNMVGLFFFIMGMIICASFVSFARCWSRLIVPWSCLDILMLFPPYIPPKRSLKYKLRLLGTCLSIVAMVEHALYYASGYYSYRMHVLHCHTNHSRITFASYVQKEFADIFEIIPYNIISVFYAFFLNGTFTFIWNFMDLFIMLVSLGLAQRFQQFARRVLKLANCFVPDALWSDIRMDHVRLCELLELVDFSMSVIILISCLNNVYFICNALLAIFTKLRYTINYIYFWYSLIFLLTRTFLVFLCASQINEASRLPLKALYMIPSESWSQEVQRFAQQITNEYIALSGCRLFYLTRKSFFGMMATLVTYEFMLLQLDAKNRRAGLPELCT
ncbi:gustatory receptor for sugar taste 61a [Drosophila tropicalis]|uniref:gustatory receptor for sugar taste 61a n=1 Tax=Drosophila tropicalis TaxID=46794 RepID=UPI0035AB9792